MEEIWNRIIWQPVHECLTFLLMWYAWSGMLFPHTLCWKTGLGVRLNKSVCFKVNASRGFQFWLLLGLQTEILCKGWLIHVTKTQWKINDKSFSHLGSMVRLWSGLLCPMIYFQSLCCRHWFSAALSGFFNNYVTRKFGERFRSNMGWNLCSSSFAQVSQRCQIRFPYEPWIFFSFLVKWEAHSSHENNIFFILNGWEKFSFQVTTL